MESKRRKLFIAFLIVSLFLFFFYVLTPPSFLFPDSVGGNFGLRPQSHRCFGLSLNAELVNNNLPEMDLEIPVILKSIEFRVEKNWDREYCLGQDIWYGE